MTTCGEIREHLGSYLDGELPVPTEQTLRAHLQECDGCRRELDRWRALADAFAPVADILPPESLWPSLERRLDGEAPVKRDQRAVSATVGSAWPRVLRPARWAAAAVAVLATGLVFTYLASNEPRAAAADISFAVLLDHLPFDANVAFERFVGQYDGQRTTPAHARNHAAGLNFDTPDELPGGFRLQDVYNLRIGTSPAVAARYDRNGEFLAAIFHPPVKHEDFGSHRDYACVVGQHRGHAVAVGEWKMVHVTDPTTCHCVLSRLGESGELPAILSVVAPMMTDPRGADHEHAHP